MGKDNLEKKMTEDEITALDSKRFKKKDLLQKLNINITVLKGEKVDFGKIFILKNRKITIGRSEENDIVLHDPRASKHHCEINIDMSEDLEVDEITLADLFSTNGTYLNGDVIENSILEFGDKIGLGSTILLFNSSDEVEETYQSTLFDIATIDSLTCLFNRRYILNDLENQVKLAKRYKKHFSLILFDIDDFKNINDSFGHQAGDEYLKLITSKIYEGLREQDKAGRVGGEEFLIILPETDARGAEVLANRIRKRIENAVLTYKKNRIKATVSAGVIEFNHKSDEPENIFEIVDVALYKAKEQGKNKVFVSPVQE